MVHRAKGVDLRTFNVYPHEFIPLAIPYRPFTELRFSLVVDLDWTPDGVHREIR